MTTCCEREIELRVLVRLMCDMLRRDAVDHRLRRIFTEEQHDNIAATYDLMCRRAEITLDSKSEAA